jgi:hypothetical protein
MSDRKVQLHDPYGTLPKKDKTVTSIAVSDADRAFIYAVHPQQSVLQTTLNCLFAEFVRAMKKAGYKSYDPEGYVNAVRNLKMEIEKREKKVVGENSNKPIPSALNV